MQQRQAQRHLLAAWNPSFRADTVESHLDCFLLAADAHRRHEIEEDEVYVWWAKVRSPRRHAPLPHIAQIVALDAECNTEQHPDREVHLYLTDYNSLYVGHVGEITCDDVRDMEDERERIPGYYFQGKIEVDCWFRLFDIRRIAAGDQFTVIDEIEKLRNTRHHDRAVSIFGGLVELPLIVTRPDGARFFEPHERAVLTNGKFWAEYDAERVGLGQMERELRENMFGDAAWRALEPATRSFVATAEKIFRDHRDDPAFDFTPVIVEFAKALEVQCNSVLRRALGGMRKTDRLVNLDGRPVDVATYGAFGLAELARVIGQDAAINRALKTRVRNADWFAASLPPVLLEVAELRNPAAHHRRIHKDEATRLRGRLAGVGYPSDLVQLAGVQPVLGSERRFTPTYVGLSA